MSQTPKPETTTEKKEEEVTKTTEAKAEEGKKKHQQKKRHHLDILQSLRQSHLQNGLRADDYQRYRQYCSRHISRTRHAIKVALVPRSQTRRMQYTLPAYAKKLIRSVDNPSAGTSRDAIVPTAAEVLRDPRYAEVQLALAERAWAHWMELRGDGSAGKTSASGVADEHTRVYYHLIKKLKKAVSWAEVLEELCLIGYVLNSELSTEEEDDDEEEDEESDDEEKEEEEEKEDEKEKEKEEEQQAISGNKGGVINKKKNKRRKNKKWALRKYKNVPGLNAGIYLKDHYNNNSSTQWCDERTALEAAVYASWMRGNLALETEQWDAALREFAASTALCAALLTTELLPERKAVLQERIDEMEPQLRFAAYNARKPQPRAGPADAPLLRPDLAGLLDTVATAAKEANATALLAQIRWGGRAVHARSPAVRAALAGVHKAALGSGEDLAAAHSKAAAALHAELDALTRKIAAKERFPAAVRALEQQRADARALVEYLQWLKAEKTAERATARARSLQTRLCEGALPITAVVGVNGINGGKPKVEEIVRLYNVAMQAEAEAQALLDAASHTNVDGTSADGDVGDGYGENAEEKEARRTLKGAHGLAVRAERCYFVGLVYLRKRRWPEADALFAQAQKLAGDARVHLLECKAPLPQDDIAAATAVEAQARAMRCVAVARSNMKEEPADKAAAAAAAKKEEEEEEEEEEVTVEEPLYGSSLDVWPESLKQNRPIIATELPKPEVLQCRPILLDVAFNAVEYPDLTARKQASKGFFKLW